jgi:hypothetical protein
MSGYQPTRRGPNVSQYIAGLNAIPCESDPRQLPTDDYNVDDDLALFTNVEFTHNDFVDFDLDFGTDLSQVPLDLDTTLIDTPATTSTTSPSSTNTATTTTTSSINPTLNSTLKGPNNTETSQNSQSNNFLQEQPSTGNGEMNFDNGMSKNLFSPMFSILCLIC